MPRHAPASASWLGSGAGSAVADCTDCCAGRDAARCRNAACRSLAARHVYDPMLPQCQWPVHSLRNPWIAPSLGTWFSRARLTTQSGLEAMPNRKRYYLPLCWFNRHAPDRRQIRWDGYQYVSNCRYCGKRIFRQAPKTWRSVGPPDHL